jgi:hypothetical protein
MSCPTQHGMFVAREQNCAPRVPTCRFLQGVESESDIAEPAGRCQCLGTGTAPLGAAENIICSDFREDIRNSQARENSNEIYDRLGATRDNVLISVLAYRWPEYYVDGDRFSSNSTKLVQDDREPSGDRAAHVAGRRKFRPTDLWSGGPNIVGCSRPLFSRVFEFSGQVFGAMP